MSLPPYNLGKFRFIPLKKNLDFNLVIWRFFRTRPCNLKILSFRPWGHLTMQTWWRGMLSQHFWMMWRADCIINFVFIFTYINLKIKKIKINFKNRKKFRLLFSKIRLFFWNLKNSKNQKQIQISLQKKTDFFSKILFQNFCKIFAEIKILEKNNYFLRKWKILKLNVFQKFWK